MQSYQCFLLYLALKNHFQKTTYDYFKYNGKVNVSANQFNKRKDKWLFEKLSKHSDPKNLLISNLIINPYMWIGDIVSSNQAKDNYNRWRAVTNSLSYQFEQQIKQFSDIPVDKWFRIEQNEHPKIIQWYIGGKISPEVFCIIVDIIKCYSYWNTNLSDDVCWQACKELYTKYRKFIDYDRDQYRKKFKTIVKFS
jgi:hypothetical protein